MNCWGCSGPDQPTNTEPYRPTLYIHWASAVITMYYVLYLASMCLSIPSCLEHESRLASIGIINQLSRSKPFEPTVQSITINRPLPSPPLVRTIIRSLPSNRRVHLHRTGKQPRVSDRRGIRVGDISARERGHARVPDLSELFGQRRHVSPGP